MRSLCRSAAWLAFMFLALVPSFTTMATSGAIASIQPAPEPSSAVDTLAILLAGRAYNPDTDTFGISADLDTLPWDDSAQIEISMFAGGGAALGQADATACHRVVGDARAFTAAAAPPGWLWQVDEMVLAVSTPTGTVWISGLALGTTNPDAAGSAPITAFLPGEVHASLDAATARALALSRNITVTLARIEPRPVCPPELPPCEWCDCQHRLAAWHRADIHRTWVATCASNFFACLEDAALAGLVGCVVSTPVGGCVAGGASAVLCQIRHLTCVVNADTWRGEQAFRDQAVYDICKAAHCTRVILLEELDP